MSSSSCDASLDHTALWPSTSSLSTLKPSTQQPITTPLLHQQTSKLPSAVPYSSPSAPPYAQPSTPPSVLPYMSQPALCHEMPFTLPPKNRCTPIERKPCWHIVLEVFSIFPSPPIWQFHQCRPVMDTVAKEVGPLGLKITLFCLLVWFVCKYFVTDKMLDVLYVCNYICM